MPEDINPSAGTEGQEGAAAPEGQEGKAGEGQEGEKPEGQEGEKPEGQEGEKPEGQEGEKPEKPEEPSKPNSSNDEPLVKKGKLEYILERKKAKLEKMKSRATKQQLDAIDKEIAELEGGGKGDDDLEEKEAVKIDKYIQRKYGDQLARLDDTLEKQTTAEVTGFISKNPQFKPYESKIKKWSEHPAYQNVPVEQIAYAAAGKELMQLGATQARKGDSEAATTQSGGTASRAAAPGTKDYNAMSDEDFEKELNLVKREQ